MLSEGLFLLCLATGLSAMDRAPGAIKGGAWIRTDPTLVSETNPAKATPPVAVL